MEKGFFPYDILDITISGVGNRQEEILVELNKILCKSEQFDKEDFHNDLTQEPCTDDNYKIYLQESEKFATRWDYLEGYNIKERLYCQANFTDVFVHLGRIYVWGCADIYL
jgi:hypothetical protein